MNTTIKYILIGIIQGLTEFLPISSSGHIVLFGSSLNVDNLLLISIVAHIGTLFAIVICYKNKIFNLIRHPFNKTNLHLILATIPTVLIFLIFNKFLSSAFETKTLIWGFLLSAIFLVVADFKSNGNNHINKKNSIYMGLSQGLALLPGISRSGTTLVCGLLCNVKKEEALDFSFLMSIPIIIASAGYESLSLFSSKITVDWNAILIVIITSFIFGIISIKIMIKLLKHNRLFYFSIYLILLSLIILIIL